MDDLPEAAEGHWATGPVGRHSHHLTVITIRNTFGGSGGGSWSRLETTDSGPVSSRLDSTTVDWGLSRLILVVQYLGDQTQSDPSFPLEYYHHPVN